MSERIIRGGRPARQCRYVEGRSILTVFGHTLYADFGRYWWQIRVRVLDYRTGRVS